MGHDATSCWHRSFTNRIVFCSSGSTSEARKDQLASEAHALGFGNGMNEIMDQEFTRPGLHILFVFVPLHIQKMVINDYLTPCHSLYALLSRLHTHTQEHTHKQSLKRRIADHTMMTT